MKTFVFVLSAVVAVAANDARPRSVAELFRSSENIALVASPELVEAWILYPRPLSASEDARNRPYDESEHRPLSGEVARRLSSILTADSTYTWDSGAKACMPIWNARLKFRRGAHYVEADLCFGCDLVQLSRDGVVFAVRDFDHVSSELFGIIRSLFPKDRIVHQIESRQKERVLHREAIRKAVESEKKG